MSQHEIWWINIIFWTRLLRSLPTAISSFQYWDVFFYSFLIFNNIKDAEKTKFKNLTRITFFFWVCSFIIIYCVLWMERNSKKNIFLIYILINIVNESFFRGFFSHRAQFSMSLFFKRLQVCFPLYKLLCFDALRVSLKWESRERFVEWKSILYCWCWVCPNIE